MTLGGLEEGVTPLDMAHAYETFAQNGRFTYSTMSPGAVDRRKLGIPVPGPAGIKVIGRKDDGKLKPIELPDGTKAESKPVSWPVLKSSVAGQVSSMLSSVVAQGTATRAQIPGAFVAGKTGTTENYGDAWFVGWTDEITVAVWVGYPDELRPMETEFNGRAGRRRHLPGRDLEVVRRGRPQVRRVRRQGRRGAGRRPAGDHRRSRRRPGTDRPRRPDHARHLTRRRAAPRTRRRRTAPEPPPADQAPASSRPRSSHRPTAAPAPRRAGAAAAPPQQRARRRRRAAVAAARGPAASRVSGRRPGGHGRDTLRDPTAQKRQGSSTALVIPIRSPATISTSSQPGGRGPIRSGPRTRSLLVELELDVERLRQLARARAQLLHRVEPAPLAHRVERGDRLERADQHRRPDALGLADRVDERVDAVGAVDVRDPGRAEQHARARRSGRRTRGRPARTRGRPRSPRSRRHVRPCVSVQPTRSRATSTHRPGVELGGKRRQRPTPGWPSSSARAWLSCSRTRASDVPPSETLDSSHDCWASTS